MVAQAKEQPNLPSAKTLKEQLALRIADKEAESPTNSRRGSTNPRRGFLSASREGPTLEGGPPAVFR